MLTINSFDHPEARVGQWQSAMTYKFVGAIRGLGTLPRTQLVALEIGFVLGFVIVSIACHIGLRTSGGTQGVGKSTTQSVVAGSVGVIAVDFFLTRILISLMY